MITRRRRTRSSGEDNDQTRVEYSSENNFITATVDMTTCRDRTSEFISAVKSLQSRQVMLKCLCVVKGSLPDDRLPFLFLLVTEDLRKTLLMYSSVSISQSRGFAC